LLLGLIKKLINC